MAGSIRPDARTVELTRDGGKTFEHLGIIPWGSSTEDEIAGPCAVILDESTVFLQGGGDGETNNRTAYCESAFLDLSTTPPSWTAGPNITKCRHYHTCSLIRNDTNGHREVVIVGGWDQTEITIQEVEIIDLETLQVRSGKNSQVIDLSEICLVNQIVFVAD